MRFVAPNRWIVPSRVRLETGENCARRLRPEKVRDESVKVEEFMVEIGFVIVDWLASFRAKKKARQGSAKRRKIRL
jgi:hypothetical protein